MDNSSSRPAAPFPPFPLPPFPWHLPTDESMAFDRQNRDWEPSHREIQVIHEGHSTCTFTAPTPVVEAALNANAMNYALVLYLESLAGSFQETDRALFHVVNTLDRLLMQHQSMSSHDLYELLEYTKSMQGWNSFPKCVHMEVCVPFFCFA